MSAKDRHIRVHDTRKLKKHQICSSYSDATPAEYALDSRQVRRMGGRPSGRKKRKADFSGWGRQQSLEPKQRRGNGRTGMICAVQKQICRKHVHRIIRKTDGCLSANMADEERHTCKHKGNGVVGLLDVQETVIPRRGSLGIGADNLNFFGVRGRQSTQGCLANVGRAESALSSSLTELRRPDLSRLRGKSASCMRRRERKCACRAGSWGEVRRRGGRGGIP